MFKCYLPRIDFGTGRIRDIGGLAGEFGSKALLAVDPFLDASGLAGEISSLLRASGIDSVKYSGIQPNPSCFKVDEAAAIAREAKCDMVIGVGGGSALDFGKGVAVLARGEGACWDYTERSDHTVRRPGKSCLPVIAVPATAGTGSEATPFAVFNNPELREKSTIVSDSIYPALAIVDPGLTVSMPRRLTASTGFDAFAHALEAYISLKATPFSRMVAAQAMRLVIRHLPEAVANGDNLRAREQVAWASTLAGAAIARNGVALPHSLGQPVSGLCGAPHGESIAACMVKILEMSCLADMESFSAVAEMLDPSISVLPLWQRAEKCPGLVRGFMRDIGLDVRFSDFGMTPGDVEKAADIALTGYYFDIACHPLKVGREEIVQIYRDCL